MYDDKYGMCCNQEATQKSYEEYYNSSKEESIGLIKFIIIGVVITAILIGVSLS